MATIDVPTSLENLKLERDAVVLYESLAAIDRDPARAAAFTGIAANERRHAGIWATKLTELGATVPEAGGPRIRIRFIVLVARLLGTRAVTDLVLALEGDEEATYEALSGAPEVAGIAADEREHARIWTELRRDGATAQAVVRVSNRRHDGVAVARHARTPADISTFESWHRTGARSGTLRAIIFGVSDGLVSNLALVMGVAGASTQDARLILLTGIAGLLAGSFSMAAGEYISMQSQRELFERQIELERAEILAMPEEEEAELAATYRAKGFPAEEAARIAHRIFQDPELALDTLVREELGLDPNELGSPIGAAVGSFLSFGLGAAIPVIPYALVGGSSALVVSLTLSLAALFLVGAGVSLLTGRSLVYSGVRQLGIGLAAAIVTYVVGSIIGVAIV